MIIMIHAHNNNTSVSVHTLNTNRHQEILLHINTEYIVHKPRESINFDEYTTNTHTHTHTHMHTRCQISLSCTSRNDTIDQFV